MKKRMICIFVLFAAVLTLTLSAAALLQRDQQRLAEKLIRLHVVARSDSAHDQAVKLAVRDAVLAEAERLTAGTAAPRAALAAGLDEIAHAAEQTLTALGEDAQVQVRLGKERFSTRVYDTFSLPAGVYESLRVTIGEGNGHNWWCVVFPSLCMTASMDELELAAEAAGFSDQELRLITGEGGGYVVRFKLLELLQQLKAALFS